MIKFLNKGAKMNFLYRVDILEKLKETGGFRNDFTKIIHSKTFSQKKGLPRLYFFKNEINKLWRFSTIEEFLKSQSYGGACPIRFRSLPNLKEHIDEEFHVYKNAYYYEFDKNDPPRIVVSIDDIQYWDENLFQWTDLKR